ncbi:hypothetical protein DL95DRAFT_479856 [Leptodontidium sp. 2 PMI_412]|nr:hypothetical protein DL95DRAFT_479856 [Leptodontidium sp. 2 PMI_412]
MPDLSRSHLCCKSQQEEPSGEIDGPARRLGGSAQPGRLHLFSRVRSRQSSRAPSPVPSRGKADNASATAGASSSTPGTRPSVDDPQLVVGANAMIPAIRQDDRVDEKSDNDQNAQLGTATDGSQDQENQGIGLKPNTDAADSAQEDNMWKIAEDQLRQDKKENELLDAYYDILKSKLNDFDSSNTSERQKQISAFIESESKIFEDASKLGPFANVPPHHLAHPPIWPAFYTKKRDF